MCSLTGNCLPWKEFMFPLRKMCSHTERRIPKQEGWFSLRKVNFIIGRSYPKRKLFFHSRKMCSLIESNVSHKGICILLQKVNFHSKVVLPLHKGQFLHGKICLPTERWIYNTRMWISSVETFIWTRKDALHPIRDVFQHRKVTFTPTERWISLKDKEFTQRKLCFSYRKV